MTKFSISTPLLPCNRNMNGKSKPCSGYSHCSNRQKIVYCQGGTAVGLPSSVDKVMNFSLPQALVYAKVGDISLGIQ